METQYELKLRFKSLKAVLDLLDQLEPDDLVQLSITPVDDVTFEDALVHPSVK